MSVIKPILKEVVKVFHSYFVTTTDVMSPDVKEIMANPEDKKKYFDAIEKLKSGEEEVKIKLSTKKEMTLTLNH
ncbi:MAG: hypothetical protein EA341_19190 [Mongoliibacter sp.]|uniref:hypothetical protein n=1 Tax=Mongoliibacter sp. TaxID=2022438 RepID=UPI0012F3D6E1|nr:hypothetical protein [Mongoliibacter sp.]TVP42764.1 MAG: hypothetical protein EA341_19190 [Mongoliibacter sp.]